MARPREFDEDEAIQQAMMVFWQKGYRNTSLDELLEAMGIQRGSFYNTFGSKKATYIRAIEHYADFMFKGGPYTELASRPPSVQTLEATFQAYLNSVTSEGGPRGCFFAHVSKEGRGDNPEIQKAMLAGIKKMKGVLAKSVKAAQESGELPTDSSPEEKATLLMATAWGMHVMAEAGVPKSTLAKAGKQLFPVSQTTA